MDTIIYHGRLVCSWYLICSQVIAWDSIGDKHEVEAGFEPALVCNQGCQATIGPTRLFHCSHPSFASIIADILNGYFWFLSLAESCYDLAETIGSFFSLPYFQWNLLLYNKSINLGVIFAGCSLIMMSCGNEYVDDAHRDGSYCHRLEVTVLNDNALIMILGHLLLLTCYGIQAWGLWRDCYANVVSFPLHLVLVCILRVYANRLTLHGNLT